MYLHKEFRAAEIGFSLHKEFHKKNHEKLMVYLKINDFQIGNEQLGGDTSENGDFKQGNSVCRVQFVSGAFILYSERNEQLRAMRQKIAIFEEGNSVCRVHIFFRSSHFIFRKK